MRLRRLVGTAVAGAIALGAAAGVASAKESITYWNPWTFGGYIKIQEDLVNRFNQAHPDIEVKIANSPGYDKLVAAVAAGAPPDVVIFFEPPDRVALPGLFLPLDSLMQNDGYKTSDFIPGSIALSSWGGHTYGVPFLGASYALTRNLSLLQEAGFDSAQAPATWTDLETIQKKITSVDSAGKTKTLGTNLWTWGERMRMGWLWSDGGSFYDPASGQVTVDSPQNREALAWLVGLAQQYGSALKGFAGGFDQGSMAVDIAGSWHLYELKSSAPDLQFGVSPLPHGPQGDFWNPGGGEANSMYIPKGSKHVQAAWTFMKWMLEEGSVLWSNTDEELPGLLAAGHKVNWSDDPKFQAFVDYTRYEKTLLTPANQYFYQHFNELTDAAISQKLAPGAALQQLDDLFTRHLSEVAAPGG